MTRVVQVSLVPHWRETFKRFAADMTVHVHTAGMGSGDDDAAAAADVIITTPSMLVQSTCCLKNME
jgi:hypothetical protein